MPSMAQPVGHDQDNSVAEEVVLGWIPIRTCTWPRCSPHWVYC